MLTLNGLLGHRRELGVEFLSVHHAKPRVEGVFALGRTLASQDTRIWATIHRLRTVLCTAWCRTKGFVHPENVLLVQLMRGFGGLARGRAGGRYKPAEARASLVLRHMRPGALFHI